ncbi:c-type cytochrome [Candidatus Sumerlaeota bacterium]|nr:c-type cytochrome [Candidatus Sumerlaeota bacterium]
MADDPDPRVRFQCALTLGQVKSPKKIEALVKIARRDADDPWVRTAILTSINEDALDFYRAFAFGSATPDEGVFRLIGDVAAVIGARGDQSAIGMVLFDLSDMRDAEIFESLQGLLRGLKMGGSGQKISIPDLLSRWQNYDRSEAIRAAAMQLSELDQIVITYSSEAYPDPTKDQRFAWDLITNVHSPRSDQERLDILKWIPFYGSGFNLEKPLLLLDPKESDEIQVAVLEKLSAVTNPDISTMILGRWPTFTPAVREKALDILLTRKERINALLDAVREGTISAAKIGSQRRAQLLKFPDPEIAEKAKEVFEADALAQDSALFEKYKPALELKGDAAKGTEIHKNRCAQCHKVGGVGYDVGPNWASVKANPPDQILMNILYPNRSIQAGFTGYVIELNDGRIATGIIAASTPTGIVLKRGGGEEETILRRNIRSMSDTALSIMPEGLEDGLTPQDFADLFAFMQGIQ